VEVKVKVPWPAFVKLPVPLIALVKVNMPLVMTFTFTDCAAVCRFFSAGAVVGSWGARVLVALAPLDLPRRSEIALDWQVGLVVSLVGLVLGLIAASAPAAWAARSSLSTLLVTGAVRGAGASQKLRRGIVVAQVALTLVLLSAGGLVARASNSYWPQILASSRRAY